MDVSDFNDPGAVKAARAADAAAPRPVDWPRSTRHRLAIVAAGLAVWFLGIEARLLYLQVFERAWMVERARKQQQLKVEVTAKRGDIVDRRGRMLAYSVEGDVIVADPSVIADPSVTAAEICAALDACAPADREQLLEKLTKDTRYQVLKRRASVAEAQRVKKIDGVVVVPQSVRYYPNRELAATVLGWVNQENKGVAGVEYAYDDDIGGRPGLMLQLHDRKARTLSLQTKQPAKAGSDIELTLDSYLQYVVERELKAAVKATDADGAVAVVLEPGSGEILAMASLPSFNPNNASVTKSEAESRRNRAVQDTFEYGSVVKVATAAAALEEHRVSLDDVFDVSSGMIQIGSRPPIHDVHTYGALSFLDIIVKSSNVGIIKVGLKIGADRMDRYFRQFGFGSKLSPDFPAERSGNVWPREKLTESAIASMAMGYQIGITPLQMVSAVNSVANGGELVEPRLVKAITRDGAREVTARKVVRRTMSRRTAEQLTGMMEQVVERGTAKTAEIDGYTLAAKTGTAAKLVDGRYSKTLYNASVVGFVPSKRPVATILVTVDSPRVGGYFGGTAAGPVFKRIAEATLRHFGVSSEDNPATRFVVARATTDETPAEPTPVRMPAATRASLAPAVQGLMPDLTGANGREALKALASLGIVPRIEGSGVVAAQSIPSGTPVERGSTCILTLRRGAIAAREAAGGQP